MVSNGFQIYETTDVNQDCEPFHTLYHRLCYASEMDLQLQNELQEPCKLLQLELVIL